MKKASAIIISAAMAAIMALGTGCGAAGERPEHNTQASAPAPSAAITATEIEPSQFEEYGVDEHAETAYTLTATVYPVSASDKTVDWTIAWANAESTWATGKTVTDYVTAQAQADGSTVCIVSCLQAFGEQIEVTVTSRANENATATCTLDYTKRLTNPMVFINGSAVSGYLELESFYQDPPEGETEGEDVPALQATVMEGVGTISDNRTYQWKVEYNQAFLDVAYAALGESVTINRTSYKLNRQSSLDEIISNEDAIVWHPSLKTLCVLLFDGITDDDCLFDDIFEPIATAYTAFLDSDIEDKWFAKVTCEIVGVKSAVSASNFFYLSKDSDHYTPVESVAMNKTVLLF